MAIVKIVSLLFLVSLFIFTQHVSGTASDPAPGTDCPHPGYGAAPGNASWIFEYPSTPFSVPIYDNEFGSTISNILLAGSPTDDLETNLEVTFNADYSVTYSAYGNYFTYRCHPTVEENSQGWCNIISATPGLDTSPIQNSYQWIVLQDGATFAMAVSCKVGYGTDWAVYSLDMTLEDNIQCQVYARAYELDLELSAQQQKWCNLCNSLSMPQDVICA